MERRWKNEILNINIININNSQNIWTNNIKLASMFNTIFSSDSNKNNNYIIGNYSSNSGLLLRQRINKILTFYNYKFLDVDVRLFLCRFSCS